MSPHETLKTAEALYNSGHISYYKTSSTSYGSKFRLEDVLAAHQLHSEWGKYALSLLEKGFDRPDRGELVGGVLPLVPIKSAEKGKLTASEWKVYQLITKNFLASISKPATVNCVDASFKIGDELFGLHAQSLQNKGFLGIMP